MDDATQFELAAYVAVIAALMAVLASGLIAWSRSLAPNGRLRPMRSNAFNGWRGRLWMDTATLRKRSSKHTRHYVGTSPRVATWWGESSIRPGGCREDPSQDGGYAAAGPPSNLQTGRWSMPDCESRSASSNAKPRSSTVAFAVWRRRFVDCRGAKGIRGPARPTQRRKSVFPRDQRQRPPRRRRPTVGSHERTAA